MSLKVKKNLLPSRYTQLEYLQSDGAQWINTEVIPDNTTGFKVRMSVPETVSDIFRFGCRQYSGATRFIIGTMNGTAYLGFGDTLAPSASGSWVISQNNPFVAQLNYLNDRHAYVNDNISSTDPIKDLSTVTFTYPVIMFGRNSSGTVASSAQTVYSCEITKGTDVVRKFIPARRRSDGVLGMYDTENSGKNLFDKSSITPNCYLDNTGTLVSNDTWNVSDYIPVNANTTYYELIYNKGVSPRTCWYTSDKTFISAVEQVTSGTLTSPANARYCRISVNFAYSDAAMFVKGSTAPTSYEPYDGFYTNSGTGTFTAGPEVTPTAVLKDIHELYKKNKNEFKIAGLAGSSTVSYSGNTITLSGTNVDSGKNLLDVFPNAKVGHTYFLSRSSASTAKSYIWLRTGGAGGQWSFGNAKTLTAADFDGTIKFYGEAANTTVVEMQIEEGSTATSYVPYGVDYIGDLYKKSRNLWSGDSSFNLANSPGMNIPLPDITKTYTFSFDVDSDVAITNPLWNFSTQDADGNYKNDPIYTIQSAVIGARVSVQVNTNHQCVKIYFRGLPNNYTGYIRNIMLEEGTVVHDYEPYGVVQIFSAGYDRQVSGATPLTIPDARTNPISWQIDGQSKQGVLPDGYTQLEYLQTDGNSCINTNLMITGNESWECVFENADSNNLSSQVLGTLNGGSAFTSKNNFSITYTTAMSPGAYAVYLDGNNGNAQYAWDGGVLTDHTKQTIRYTGLNIAPTINGVTMTQLDPTTLIAITPTVGVRLFGRATTAGNGTFAQSGVRIYSFKGDTWNFIPAKNSSNVLGMYDTVTGQFFTNAGTGDFIAGPTAPSPSCPVDVNGCGNSGLPNGYKKLEYIESSGTQWIDTGYAIAHEKAEIEFKVRKTGDTGVKNWWGSAINNTKWFTTYSTTNKLYAGSSSMVISGPSEINTDYVLKYATDGNGNVTQTVDGVIGTAIAYNSSIISGQTFCLWNEKNSVSRVCPNLRYYWFKITDNDVLVRHFIPAQRKSDSVIGMYDTVTNTFFTNAGTGNFIAGPEDTSCVVPMLQANNCGIVDLGAMNISKTAYGCSFEKSDMAQTETNAYITGYSLGRGDKTFRIVPVVSTVYVGIQDERFVDMTIEQIKELLSGKYLYYQRVTDETWNAPTTTNINLPAPLHKIGTYKDTIESDGTLTRQLASYVMTGTESFTDQTSGNHRCFFNPPGILNPGGGVSSPDCMSTIGIGDSSGTTANTSFIYGGRFYFVFDNGITFPTLADFTNYLVTKYANNDPVIIYYPLATATETTVEVPQISTVSGTNYVDVETQVKPSNMSVTYRKKTK